MTPSTASRGGHILFSLAAGLATLVSIATTASAQTYRMETLLGDFDPLEEVPLSEAWVRHPSGLAVDAEGSLYFVDRDSYRVRKIDPSGRVSTVAGSGLVGFGGDGGPATSARLGLHVEGLAVDGEGNLYIADTESLRIRRVDRSGTITTIAGTGGWGSRGDGGPAINAGLTAVYGLAADTAGNLYVADTWNDSVRKIGSDGIITTVAGTGDEGRTGDGGPATQARLNKPQGVAIDEAGNLYIADADNHRVRRVDPSGTIITIAGTGEAGYSGDGGLASEAALAEPQAVSVDGAGNVYIADGRNGIIRKVGADGTISTVAGIPPGTDYVPLSDGARTEIGFPRALATGRSGELYFADSYRDAILRLDEDGSLSTFVGLGQPDLYRPGGAAANSSGTVFVADTQNHRILRIDSPGVATAVAGSGASGFSGDGGPAASAEFSFPGDVAAGADGTIYIADTFNHRIRKVDSGGTVTTVAGTGEPGFGGDGGPALSAAFDEPAALAVGADGAIYVVDEGNRRIRMIDATGVVTTVAGNGDYGTIQVGVPATQSPLDWLIDVAVDSIGRIYITAIGVNQVLRVDTAGLLEVAAGTGEFGDFGDGAPATAAQLWGPTGLAVSESDTLYIADTYNHQIRRVTPDGIITTIGGSGIGGYDGDGAPATMFALQHPERVAAATDEAVVVVDTGNHRLRTLVAEAPRPVITAILNGASYAERIAPGSVAVIRGTNLSPGIGAADALPQSVALPTALLGTSVTVADRTETSWARRVAGLYSVSPTEIRFQIPERAAKGLVIFRVNHDGSMSEWRAASVTGVAPGLFSANGDGRGVAAATAVRVARDGTETALDVARYDTFGRRYVAVPLDVRGNRDPVYVTLYGTGVRGGSDPPRVTIAGQDVAVKASRPASGFHGVDELVVGPISRSIQGSSLDVVTIVDGQVSNPVTIAVK